MEPINSEIADFEGGPGPRQVLGAIARSLYKWRPRPLSLWQEELVQRDWTPLQARIVTRVLTLAWAAGIQLGIALLIVGAVVAAIYLAV